MEYFANSHDLKFKTEVMTDLLFAQTQTLKNEVAQALARFDDKGNDARQLADSFFSMVGAVEKIVFTREAVTGKVSPKALSKLLADLRAVGESSKNKLEIAQRRETKAEISAHIQQAMQERLGQTLH